jgi:hypothetical protein
MEPALRARAVCDELQERRLRLQFSRAAVSDRSAAGREQGAQRRPMQDRTGDELPHRCAARRGVQGRLGATGTRTCNFSRCVCSWRPDWLMALGFRSSLHGCRAPIWLAQAQPGAASFVRNGAQDRHSASARRAAGDEATILRRRLRIGGATRRGSAGRPGWHNVRSLQSHEGACGWQQAWRWGAALPC